MSEALSHVASGKVREIYALDDERLLLVASDRISTFDVVLPTEIPDKGRVLTGLSGFWFAQTAGIVPNHLLALGEDGRSTECRRLEMLPIECVVRGYLAGSGWKDYRASGEVCGHRAARRARRVRPAAGADLHAGDQGPVGPRREHRPRGRRRARRRGALRRGRAADAGALPLRLGTRARARDHPRRHEARVRRRRRRPARARRRGVHPGLVALLARRRVRARRPAALVRQAVRPRLLRDARLGQDRARAPSCPPTSSRERAPATSRRSSSSPGSTSPTTWPIRSRCCG